MILGSIFLAALAGGRRTWPQASSSAVERLKSPEAETRAQAARELGKSGDLSAVTPLAAAINDSSDKVRREVVVALGQFHSPEVLDPLIAATRDPESSVRVLALRALAGYYTGQAPSIGFAAFWEGTWRKTKGHFVEENVRIDPGVSVEPKVLSAFVAVMKDQRAPGAARLAAESLGVLLAKAAVPDLVNAAHSSDQGLALEALNSLEKIKDTSAGHGLLDLLDSSDKDIQQQAAVTVGILRTQGALPKLQSMYQNNPDKKTREKALEGLAYLGSPLSVPVFLQAIWNPEKNLRQSAAEGLARAGDPKALPDLQKAAQVEKDAAARLAIQFAITALGKDDYLSRLINELTSKFRGDIAQAYLIELSRNPRFLPKLYPYLDSQDATIRRRLCTVLTYSGDSSSLVPLERLSRDSNSDVASEALRALRAVRARTGAAGPAS